MRKLVLILALAAAPLGAQSVERPKDPSTALGIGLAFPGAGNIYAGSPAKGAALAVIAIGAPIAGYATSQRGRCKNDDCTGPHYTNLYVGIGASLLSWVYGFTTAPEDARRYNQRMKLAVARKGIGVAVTF